MSKSLDFLKHFKYLTEIPFFPTVVPRQVMLIISIKIPNINDHINKLPFVDNAMLCEWKSLCVNMGTFLWTTLVCFFSGIYCFGMYIF